jgi:hypothetical protein
LKSICGAELEEESVVGGDVNETTGKVERDSTWFFKIREEERRRRGSERGEGRELRLKCR